MSDPLRYSGCNAQTQHAVLVAFLRDEPVVMEILAGIVELGLPDAWLVSGTIYNLVWNRLSDLSPLTGIKDADIAYFDAGDLTYEAEDVAIRRAAARFAHLPLPVELRNQARVHLWFPQKFNQPFSPLGSAVESLERYASRTHAVAARLESDGTITVAAPFGLGDIFSFRVTPNHALMGNAPTHLAKAQRAKAIWPQITIIPW